PRARGFRRSSRDRNLARFRGEARRLRGWSEPLTVSRERRPQAGSGVQGCILTRLRGAPRRWWETVMPAPGDRPAARARRGPEVRAACRYARPMRRRGTVATGKGRHLRPTQPVGGMILAPRGRTTMRRLGTSMLGALAAVALLLAAATSDAAC